MILLIYHNEEERRQVTKALEPRYEVNAYGELGEAVICARLSHPDVIVLDDQVRSPDGQSAVTVLRHFFKHPPIVFCAGPGHLAKGVDERLEKPFHRSQLINVLAGLMSKTIE